MDPSKPSKTLTSLVLRTLKFVSLDLKSIKSSFCKGFQLEGIFRPYLTLSLLDQESIQEIIWMDLWFICSSQNQGLLVLSFTLSLVDKSTRRFGLALISKPWLQGPSDPRWPLPRRTAKAWSRERKPFWWDCRPNHGVEWACIPRPPKEKPFRRFGCVTRDPFSFTFLLLGPELICRIVTRKIPVPIRKNLACFFSRCGAIVDFGPECLCIVIRIGNETGMHFLNPFFDWLFMKTV